MNFFKHQRWRNSSQLFVAADTWPQARTNACSHPDLSMWKRSTTEQWLCWGDITYHAISDNMWPIGFDWRIGTTNEEKRERWERWESGSGCLSGSRSHAWRHPNPTSTKLRLFLGNLNIIDLGEHIFWIRRGTLQTTVHQAAPFFGRNFVFRWS